MNCLISVHNKTGLESLGRELIKLGISIYASSGTHNFLQSIGISSRKIQDLTNYPEILDGRVKTLHPAIFGGILARTDQFEELKKLNLEKIDIVICNLYPFASVTDPSKLIENIDIGGVSLIRAAAKNFERVTVIVDPSDYQNLIDQLNAGISEEFRISMALKAFSYTSVYDSVIYKRLWKLYKNTDFSDTLFITGTKHTDLRYGENPHQRAAYYLENGEWFEQVHGKELSFNNIADMSAALDIVQEFKAPAVAIVKHSNPCGAALGSNVHEAYTKALEGDPVSAYGAIISTNSIIDLDTAKEMKSLFIEVLVAPDFEPKALEFLKRSKKNIRLIKIKNRVKSNFYFRQVASGYLVQDPDIKQLDQFRIVTKKVPNEKELEDLKFAWKVVKYVKSNAIVIVKDLKLLGVGAGQMSRIDAVRLAAIKASNRAEAAVLASDAYFPFRDNVDEAAKYQISAIIQPGGSIRDEDVIAAADEHKIAMIFTDYRVFRH